MPHEQTTDTSSDTAALNQTLNRGEEKSQGQENKIIIVSKQPQKKNNIRGMSHKGATLATHRKTPCQVLKVEYNYQ